MSEGVREGRAQESQTWSGRTPRSSGCWPTRSWMGRTQGIPWETSEPETAAGGRAPSDEDDEGE
jgi:hypothetical protein